MAEVLQPNRPLVVCYGDLVTDLVMAVERLPIEADRVQSIRAISVEPGGAGNFLITAARLGARAVAFGAVGEDAYGQAVYDMLQAEGVDVSYAQRGAGSVNVLVLVIVDDAGQHVFLVRDGVGDPFVLDARSIALIRSADLFFMPGYALHERRVAGSAVLTTRIAAEAGVPVMNDLGPIVSEARVREAALEIVRLSEVSLLTADEAMRFTGEHSEAGAAQWMLARGTRHVVIKRGGEGCAVYSGDRCHSVPGIPVVARDTTAAGDAFAAGFGIAWLKHRDVRKAAEFANCVGAAKVRKLGSGRQCPTVAEVAALCPDKVS
ncbi:MAG: ribokinase [Candidatus Roseilinea sp.]|nr:MAG: ribokinase [Candidatus Roseilinea sp.]